MISYYERTRSPRKANLCRTTKWVHLFGYFKTQRTESMQKHSIHKGKKERKNSVDSLIEDGGLVSMETPLFSVFTQYVQDIW